MKLGSATRFAFAAAALCMAGFTSAQAEPVEMKAAIYTGTPTSPFRTTFDAFVEFANEQGTDELNIASVVGPEAIPTNQQARALADGLVDIVAAPPSYFENLVPGLGGISAPRVTTQEMRTNGAFDAINEFLEPAGIRMVGLYAGDVSFHIFTNEPVRSLDDFKGLRLRTTNTVKALFNALEAEPLQISRGEIYTALERGVANGYSNINSELYGSSWIEVAKYRVGPGFYTPNIAIFMNLERYNGLSEKQRAVIEAAGLYVEGGPSWAMQAAEEAAIERAVTEDGFEVIDLPEEDSAKFLDIAYESTWEQITERAPEFSAKLKPLLLGHE
ncbi:TRAP transporter substrate-binding protein DctP [Marivibrio halodurans]|uniref:TRAP transporter substrate-binding protein DctP n=1 Tax=Marivibrio halodurans TaxID=2039722 RepID=A0A8J7S1K8_9PROT|nr:TRAP transporter substrate-binding protein DctP [Marivibrio halodurans]MBP5858590.1 TRAP transporter substrate-binding protein DctP [Marivibrio halodurans]